MHANAFGFGIPADTFDFFIDKCYNKLKDFDFNTCYKVDFIFKDEQLQDCDMDELLELGMLYPYWGTGLEEPYLAFENIPVTSEDVTLMSPDKNPTLKIILPNGLNCIKFKATEEEFNEFTYSKVYLNIIGKIKINEWGGKYTPQLLIEDYEIKDKIYYF